VERKVGNMIKKAQLVTVNWSDVIELLKVHPLLGQLSQAEHWEIIRIIAKFLHERRQRVL